MRQRRWGGGGQEELVANRCPGGSLDVWQRGVDTEAFHPRRRTAAMRARLSANRPHSTVLIYVGRLGSGVGFFTPFSLFPAPVENYHDLPLERYTLGSLSPAGSIPANGT